MTGTPNQIEWADQIKPRVDAEFERVAQALKAVAVHQNDADRAETQSILSILEEKRGEVMANERAGYFFSDWREIDDQVRRMIAQDPRHQVIQSNKAARRTQVTDQSRSGELKAS